MAQTMAVVRMIRPVGGIDLNLPAKQIPTWKNKKNHTVQAMRPGGPTTYPMVPAPSNGADLDDGLTGYVYANQNGVPVRGVSYMVVTKTVGRTTCEAQLAYYKTFFDEGKLCAFFVSNEPLFPPAPVGSHGYEVNYEDAYKVWRLQLLVVTLKQVFAEASDADQQDIEEYAAKTFSVYWMKVIKGFEIEGADKLSYKTFVALVMNSPEEKVRLVHRVKNCLLYTSPSPRD